MPVLNKLDRVWVMVVSVLILASGNSWAQGGPGAGGQRPSPPTASEMVAQMKKAMGLTDAQVSQITPIIEESMSRMTALMKQGGDPSSSKSQMEAIRKSMLSKMAQYLTQEQLAKMTSNQSGGQGGARSGKGGSAGNAAPSGGSDEYTSGATRSAGRVSSGIY